MNKKIIVKVLPAEGSNPEFAPGKYLQDGVECDGFLLLTFGKEGRLKSSALHGISRKNLSDAIRHHALEGIVPMIRQAALVAEGEIRALEIEIQKDRQQLFEPLVKSLVKDYAEDFPDEEEQDFPEEVPQEFPEDE